MESKILLTRDNLQQQLTILKNQQAQLIQIFLKKKESNAPLEKKLEEVEKNIKELEAKLVLSEFKDTLSTNISSATWTILDDRDPSFSSEKGFNSVDESYWYSDVDINRLLNLLVLDKQEANILLAPNSYELFIETLERAAGFWQGNTQEQGNVNSHLPSLLPLNISLATQEVEVNQGNHWVGLFIKPVDSNRYDIFYVDSKGSNISDYLHAIILSVLGDSLRALEAKSILQQANDSDCGPFLVDNLVNLLREKALMQAADGHARDIRIQHAAILPLLKKNKPSVSLPNKLIGRRLISRDKCLESEVHLDIQYLQLSSCKQPIEELLVGAEKLIQQDYIQAEKAYIEILEIANINRICFKQTKYYQDIVNILCKLADISLAKTITLVGDLPEDHKVLGDMILKAIMFYNAALTINAKYVKNKELQQRLTSSIKAIQKLFIEKIKKTVIDVEGWEAEQKYYDQWEIIKKNAKEGLERVDIIKIKSVDDYNAFYKRAINIRVIYEEIAEAIKAMLSQMIEECIENLGPSPLPCEYAFICFGSLAKKSATPYSDIEFGILIEEGKDTIANKQYFRNVSYLLGIKIINLGQTVIPKDLLKTTSDIPIILDDILTPGLQLDLGGKTPLGRKGRNYELIQTPAEMEKYLLDQYFEIDKLLPIELATFSFMHGDEKLVTQFQEKIQNYLSKDLVDKKRYQIRAFQILFEGINSICSDLDKYQIRIEKSSEEGKLYDIKKEIYRLPSTLIEGLALYCGVIVPDLWKKIEILSTKDNPFGKVIFNSTALNNLNLLISISAEIRLRTYLKHDAQREALTIFKSLGKDINPIIRNNQIKDIFGLPDKYETDIGMLFIFYYIAVPLYKTIKSFFQLQSKIEINQVINKALPKSSNNENDINLFFYEECFFDSSDMVKGDIYKRLLLFSKAREHYEKELKHHLYIKSDILIIVTLYNNLGNIANHFDEWQSAIVNYFKAQEYLNSLYKNENRKDIKKIYVILLGRVLLNIANSMQLQGLYIEAEKLIRDVRTSYNNLGVIEHSDDGLLNLSISDNLIKQNQYTEEVRNACNNGLLDIYSAYGNEHLYFVKALINLAEYHFYSSNFDEAENKLLEALKIMRNTISGNMPHYCLVDIYYQLALIRKHQSNYNDSLIYCCIAISMRFDLDVNLIGAYNLNYAVILNCMGDIFIHIHKPADAIYYLEEAEKIYLHKSIYNADLASIYNSLANAYEQIRDIRNSLKYIDMAISIIEQCLGKNNLDMASLYHTKASIYKTIKQPRQAILMWIKAIEIHLALDKKNKNLAIDLFNLGCLLQECSNNFFNLAGICYFLAQNIFIYGDFASEYLNLVNSKLNAVNVENKNNDATYNFSDFDWNLFLDQLKKVLLSIDDYKTDCSDNEKLFSSSKLIDTKSFEDMQKECNWHQLHWEAASGNVEAIEWLVKCVDINIEDNQKRTPLHVAIHYCQLNAISKLSYLGANLEAKSISGATPLHMAVAVSKGEQIIKALLDCKVSMEIQDDRGCTPLYWAILERKIETAKLLIGYGASINTTDKLGYTILHSAVQSGAYEIVQWLLENKIDIDARDNNGWTALHRAIHRSNVQMVKILISYGADIKLKTSKGFSVFDICQQNDDEAVIDFIDQYKETSDEFKINYRI